MEGKRVTLLVIVACGLLSVFLHACGDSDDRDVEGVIRQRVESRTSALVAKQLNECSEDILEIALRRADSLLIDRVRRLSRIDGRPPKPRRPGAPPVKELSSPLPLRPLFPFEIRFDTLLRDSLFLDSLRMDSIDRGLLMPADTFNQRSQ